MRAGEYWNSGNIDKSVVTPVAVAIAGWEADPAEDLLPADEVRLFLALGIGKPALAAALRKAQLNGTTIERELIADGILDPHIFYEALADWLGLPFFASINPANVFLTESIDTQLEKGALLRLSRPSLPALLVVAPEVRHAIALRDQLLQAPHMRDGLGIAAPQTIREAIWKANARSRVDKVTDQLFGETPVFSARIVLTGWQGYMLGALSVGFPLAIVVWPDPILLLLHIALSLSLIHI